VTHKNWFRKHEDIMTVGERVADSVATGMGSWKFIIIQTVIVLIWMVLNVVALTHHWDPYPFILLNLLFSTQAAYAAPIIMMSQNRAAARDKIQAEHQYQHQELELQENTELTKAVHELTKMVHDHIVKEK
jgi:uncharacterized membrane protein